MRVRLPRRIGARLALYVFLVSLLLAIAGAGVQTVFEYRDERALVEMRLAEIQEAYLKPLASSLWATDYALVAAQLEGIVSVPEVERVTLTDEDGRVRTVGSLVSERTAERVWPLFRRYKGRDVYLGEVRVDVGLDPMLDRAVDHLVTVFGVQALIILVVSSFLFVIMHFVVTRRVAALSEQVRDVRPEDLDRPLARGPLLSPGREPDEIGSLVDSFEVMRATLAASYDELRQHRENLEHDVSERTSELGAANEQLRQEVEVRSRAQEALRSSEARLRVLLQHVPGAMWTVDHSLRVLSAGGRRTAELDIEPGRELERVLAEDPEALRVHRAALDGITGTCEILREGSVYELAVEPLEPGAGASALAVALDVTERRRAESERLERRLYEAQRLESLGLLAGGIAHDFNNLLVGVLGNASLARMQLEDGSSPHRLVSQIETVAQRAAALTAQMLAYSGRGRFVVEPIDVAALAREMAGLLRASISKKVELRFDAGESRALVEADVSQLRQLVMNLVMNAADAIGDAEGTVTVTTRVVDADSAALDEASPLVELAPGRYVVFEVSDTGVGMDEETRGRMFEPFFTTKTTGHGLGLAACLGIVRGHRGAVEVRSEPGRGTTITVMLPATARAALEPAVREAPAESPPVGGTVLVVDDDSTVRLFLRESLQHAGFEVLEAEDGVDGVAVYAREGGRIDVVVLDMTMPRLDGEETFRELRRRDPDALVLLSSGYDEQEASARLSGSGLAGFLQKPYRAADVIDSVTSIIARRRAAAGLPQ